MCRGGFRAVRERPAVGFLVRGCRGRVRFSGRFRGASFEIPFGDRQGTRFAGRYGEFRVRSRCVLYTMYAMTGGSDVWGFAVFVVAAFSALRLAKFNLDENQTTQFIGLPTPACALFFVSAGYLMQAGAFTAPAWVMIAAAVVFAGLLVCNVPMFALKFTHYRFAGNRVRYVFALCSLAALCAAGIAAIPFIILAYIVVSVSVYAFRTQR